MFGKKKSSPASEKPPVTLGHVNIMPSEFYGGNDPVIYPKKKTSVPKQQLMADEPPKEPTPPATQPPTGSTQTVNESSPNGRLFFGVLIIGVLVGLAGIVWYQLSQTTLLASPTEDPIIDQEPPVSDTPTPTLPPPTTPVVIVTSTLQEQQPVTTTSQTVAMTFPSTQGVASLDLDADDLTDEEEAYFTTDSGTFDTDQDGYFDGLEVRNLYNPRGPAPAKLIDSGLVREYVHQGMAYRVYYPNGWSVAAVDSEATQVLVSAISGDYIEIVIKDKEPNEPFIDWFARVAKGQRYSQYIPKTNRFSLPFYQREDGLVAMIEDDRAVYVLLYRSADQRQIRFGHIMDMMVQSFRPANKGTALQEQAILAPESASSTPDERLNLPPESATTSPSSTSQTLSS